MGDSDKPPDIESYVVSTIAIWLSKMTPRECEVLSARHFSYDVLTKYGVDKINESNLAKVVRNNDGLNDILSNRVVTAVNVLKNLKPCPRFIIPPDQVEFIPGIPVTGDSSVNELTVTSRLNNLEKNHDVVMKTLNEIRQSMSSHMSAVVQTQAPASFGGHAIGPSIHLIPPSQGGQRTNAAAATSLRERSLSNSSNRSTGSKRNRDEVSAEENSDSWATVAGKNKKKKPTVQQGNSKVSIAEGENVVLPFEVYIGNTHPKSNPEIITKYLKECFDIVPSEKKPVGSLDIMNIECCTKPRDDGKEPWCLNWRVTVDQKFREYMLSPDAIPLGWTSRRYFPPRAKRPPPAELHPSKIPNTRQTALLKTAASSGQTETVSGETISNN